MLSSYKHTRQDTWIIVRFAVFTRVLSLVLQVGRVDCLSEIVSISLIKVKSKRSFYLPSLHNLHPSSLSGIEQALVLIEISRISSISFWIV